MQKTNKLRASNSEQWTNCAGSVKAQEGLPDIPSSFAIGGQLAHEMAAYCLNNVIFPDELPIDVAIDIEEEGYDPNEMQSSVTKYIHYIKAICDTSSLNSIFIEQDFNISRITLEDNATVTPDFVYFQANGEIEIIDFKYGKGVKVYAYQNTQLLFYALAVIEHFSLILDNHTIFRLHIVQPRLNHYDKWSITVAELEEWKKYFQDKAKLALDPNAIRTPHEKACRWCKAKPTCPAIYDLTKKVVLQKVNKTNLTEDDIKTILDNRKLIIDFINTVESKVYQELSEGKEFKGYHLKPGNSIRKLREDCLQEFIEFLGEAAFEKKVIGISKAKELLDKQMIEKFFERHANKPILERTDV